MNWDSGEEPKNSLDRRRDRTDIYKALGGDDVQILKRHALTDDALHAREAYAELVLKQLAHAADAAVAEMVDIVGLADAVEQGSEVIDGGEDIVVNNMLGDKHVDILADGVLESVALVLLAKLVHNDAANPFPLMPSSAGSKST